MSMGNRIHTCRKNKSMTMEELAKRVGVQKSAINKYEKGIVANIPPDRLKRIAEVLETTPTYLMYGDGLTVRDDGTYNPFYDMENDSYGTDIEWRKVHGAIDDRPKLTEIVRLCIECTDDVLDKIIAIIKTLKA